MGISVVTPANSFEPITLDEALAQCRISSDTENGLVAGYIIAARQYAERVLRSPILVRTYDYTLDFNWPWVRVESFGTVYYVTRIELPVSPVKSVAWVKYVDADGNTQTLDASQYVIKTDVPVPFVDPAYGVTWPNTRWQLDAVSVRFDAGLASTLTELSREYEPVRQALLMLISYWYDNRGASAPSGGRDTEAGNEIPPSVGRLLSFDRRVRMAF